MSDKIEEKAMVLVKETKKFYLETIFIIGLMLFVIIRMFLIGNSYSNTQLMITQYIYFGVVIIFLLRIAYKYLNYTGLKKGFKNKKDNKRLEKYMKNNDSDDIPSKFKEDDLKEKKKFYKYIFRAIIIIALLIILNFLYPTRFQWEVVIILLTIIVIYRYLVVFHLDKKLFSDNWENKKKEEFIRFLK
ncbi:MAG: 2TM domain-containing protein [Methanobrevibacter sp.]|jgi:cell division protein FtsW (lipid II flippase)|nr:2TM domain-containing protein [Candidatus Methanovirga meridionalis]